MAFTCTDCGYRNNEIKVCLPFCPPSLPPSLSLFLPTIGPDHLLRASPTYPPSLPSSHVYFHLYVLTIFHPLLPSFPPSLLFPSRMVVPSPPKELWSVSASKARTTSLGTCSRNSPPPSLLPSLPPFSSRVVAPFPPKGPWSVSASKARTTLLGTCSRATLPESPFQRSTWRSPRCVLLPSLPPF